MRRMNNPHENAIPLTHFSVTKKSNSDSTEQLEAEASNVEAGIVCTTHITIREDYLSLEGVQEGFSLQHPWMGADS